MSDDVFADEIVAYDVVRRETLHEGRLFTFVEESFDYNGVDITREFFLHPGAVGVIALDDNDRLLTIRQYRHAIRTRGWEAPAGLLDKTGEPLLAAAQRELAEEADIQAATWHVLLDIAPMSGGSTELVRIFLARGLSPVEHHFVREAEEADIEVRWVALDDVVSAAAAGRIRNVILVAGALAAARARDEGWASLREADPVEV